MGHAIARGLYHRNLGLDMRPRFRLRPEDHLDGQGHENDRQQQPDDDALADT